MMHFRPRWPIRCNKQAEDIYGAEVRFITCCGVHVMFTELMEAVCYVALIQCKHILYCVVVVDYPNTVILYFSFFLFLFLHIQGPFF